MTSPFRHFEIKYRNTYYSSLVSDPILIDLDTLGIDTDKIARTFPHRQKILRIHLEIDEKHIYLHKIRFFSIDTHFPELFSIKPEIISENENDPYAEKEVTYKFNSHIFDYTGVIEIGQIWVFCEDTLSEVEGVFYFENGELVLTKGKPMNLNNNSKRKKADPGF